MVIIMTDEFVVNDKRLFRSDGQVNHEAEEASRPEPAAEEPTAGDFTGPFPSSEHLPPANFASLLVGLATSAFIHLGETAEENGTRGPVDLPAAKHAIDLLAILQTKTRGNLENEEEALLNTLLYDLRLKYVQATPK